MGAYSLTQSIQVKVLTGDNTRYKNTHDQRGSNDETRQTLRVTQRGRTEEREITDFTRTRTNKDVLERRTSLREHSISEEVVKKNTAYTQRTDPRRDILQSDRNTWNQQGRLNMK